MYQNLVSVCLITYNQVEFISEAIESILMQRVSFDIEIIIADDFSTDGTRQIIIDYAKKDLRIKPILRNKNVGAGTNFVEMLAAAKGKYIAYLEGDDYWTDRYKLQKQADFMEQNDDYAICFHNSEERYHDSPEQASFLYCNSQTKAINTIEDLCFSNFIPSCSLFYRNNLFGVFPEWYHSLKMGDWPLHILNAQYGKIKYIPQVMAVHRLYKGGTWSLQSHKKNIEYILDAYDVFIAYFSSQPQLAKLFMAGKVKLLKESNGNQNSLINRIRNKIYRTIKG
jgi:glycosyltransferase involved in cell wall biosynthesis